MEELMDQAYISTISFDCPFRVLLYHYKTEIGGKIGNDEV